MKWKLCKKCWFIKSVMDFYPSKKSKSGIDSWCKQCSLDANRRYRAKSEKIREYDRQRHRKNRRDPEGKKKVAASFYKWKEKNRDAYLAHHKVSHAKKSGKIVRGPCEVCGNPRTHAHHDDYSKPLEVRWLCPLHHSRAHHRR